MCNFGIPVWHHLEDNKAKWSCSGLKINHITCKIIELTKNTAQKCWDTNLAGSTHLIFTQDFNAGTQCHQGLVDITCTWDKTLLNTCKCDRDRFLWFKDRRPHGLNWPASRRRLPCALVLLVRSLPARSTRHSWLTFTWFLSWNSTTQGLT